MDEPQRRTSEPVYDTPDGHAFICRVLADWQPSIEPHNYQLEGIAKSLDGVDLLATMATGAGKTGFYCFLMIVVVHLSKNPEQVLDDREIPLNPCMLLVCPTKALQDDMVSFKSR